MNTIIITATKTYPNNTRRKPEIVTEECTTFGVCRKRMQEIATPFAKVGLTITPTSVVNFRATGNVLEGRKVVAVQVDVIAEYINKPTRVVTDRPSIVITKRWQDTVAQATATTK